jgi:hypothetical protein
MLHEAQIWWWWWWWGGAGLEWKVTHLNANHTQYNLTEKRGQATVTVHMIFHISTGEDQDTSVLEVLTPVD